MAVAALFLAVLMVIPTSVHSIGVCYGRLGDNLPQPSEVVDLYKSSNIGGMRIYDPYQPTLEALRGSNIQLIVNVFNGDLQSLASNALAASDWVQNNIKAYPNVSFRYIAVGNEVIPGDLAGYVLPAMNNIYSALSASGLQGQINVSTSVSLGVLGVSYPPSAGAFSSNASQYIGPIIDFLARNGLALLVNVHPYFSYIDNMKDISIEYALFTSQGTIVQDGEFGYQNLFDALVDAIYSALEKVGGASVEIIVSETGWPSGGGTAASVDNARIYNQNLINHVGQGTPKRSGRAIETYIFAMFNENQKPAGVEQNWGLFEPTDKQHVYPINIQLVNPINISVPFIGVCYGRLGDNLPQPSEVVDLYKSNNIGGMRIYDPFQPTLEALRGSNIQLIVDVLNEDLQSLASNASAASDWVQNNIKAYPNISFRYIAVGNEVIPGDLAGYVLPAMNNIQFALSADGLQGQIKVSTSVSESILGVSYPPSAGAFSSNASQYIGPIVYFLARNGSALLVNVHPYFSYIDNMKDISIEYALFTSQGTIVQDGEFGYQNLFDALVDAIYSALENVGGASVEIVVSETGWPSGGGTATSMDNARIYNQNLINHVGQGTPKRSGRAIETYIFSMFNENQKPAGVEQNWGLFEPTDKQHVYPINIQPVNPINISVPSIGVCYGRLGDNLPQPSEVVDLYKSNNIGGMRIYDPYQPTLEALRGSNIQLIVDILNKDLQSLASNASAASDWVQNNIKAYPNISFRYITVGNEVILGDLAGYVLPAMNNIQFALSASGLQGQIKVSTSISESVLGVSYPPSAGAFSSNASQYIGPIVDFLASNGSALLVNVHPYFSYIDNMKDISIEYALFTSPRIIVQDGKFGYQNLFDAMVDAVYSALEKVGGASVEVVVSETGWPSGGGTVASADNARTYNQNLINHVGQGTPKRSGRAIETYIFSMFNEELKPAGVDQNWGLFYPNKQPVYQINIQHVNLINISVRSIGVCYGRLGDNLPQPSEVVDLYKSNSIGGMRIFDTYQPTLEALQGSNIQLDVGVVNEDLRSLASNASAASDWVQNNIKAYPNVSFRYIAVGNEVIPGDLAGYVLPAMNNIQSALSAGGLQGQIKVSTLVSKSVLGVSYPPSAGSFSSNASQYIGPIVDFLASNGSSLLVNVHPYFSYIDNMEDISIEYALFTSPGTVVQDGKFGYQNLFDAMVDAIYSALEKVGGASVEVVVSETGWPSGGGTAASVENARTYNQNLINHVGQGTPKRSGKAIETHILAMFDENQKRVGVEQNWGLFYPTDKQPVYPINLS